MRKGIILPIVIISLVFLALVVPLMVKLAMEDTTASVRSQKKSIAFNLAEAAVARGYWKIKSSTSIFSTIMSGASLSGYCFDTTYKDIDGGEYRISISSGPLSKEVTIIGEGRDLNNNETRAIKVIYRNSTIPGAIISGGMLTATGQSIVHWGPMMSMGDMTLSGSAANRYYPRKLSKGVVSPRDPTGDLNPPNTDNLEWWSNYDVPELPVFDFTTLRASAAATGTLNCKSGGGGGGCPGFCSWFPWLPACSGCGGGGGSDLECCWASSCTYSGAPCTNCSVNNFYKDSRKDKDYTWYWDNNSSWSGQNGVRGTVIVRGNLSIAGTDEYCSHCTVNVPQDAWQEYQKIDSGSINQYPGDTGYHSNAATYTLGSCGSSCEGGALGADLGIYGFAYIGGDFNRTGDADVYGALWIVGNVSGSGNTMVFYDEDLELPTLNVVLVKQSWREVTPSTQVWN